MDEANELVFVRLLIKIPLSRHHIDKLDCMKIYIVYTVNGIEVLEK